MAALSDEGIILRKYPLRETSFILVAYTREHGKIKGVIKGARNPAPQFAGSLELFTRCGMLFYKKRKSAMDLITQCDALETFLPARKEIERLTYANYFIELIDVVTSDNDPNDRLYRVLLQSLRMLGTEASPRRTGRIFEIKLLGEIGLSPQLDECAECGKEVSGDISFSAKSGGIVCASCGGRASGLSKVSRGTVNFLRKIKDLDMDKTSRIKVSKDVGRETEKVLGDFMLYHIARPVKSARFLKGLKRAGMVQ